MDRLLGAGSGSTSPARQRQYARSKNFRRNTIMALAVCLVIMCFAALPSNQHTGRTERELRRHSALRSEGSAEGVLQKLQPHTLTVEECTGGQCTKEVVNVHDTAMLEEGDEQHHIQQQNRLQNGSTVSTNSTDSRLGTVSIQKQVGRPLVVTVKQDESDPGQHVESGGALLTDEAKDRVATLSQASHTLASSDPTVVQRAAEIADELSKHSAAAHHEGDNVLEMHRDDIDISSNAFDAATLSNRTQLSDENSLQILQDTNSTSLLSGFNSESLRAQRHEQQDHDPKALDVRIGSSR